MSCTAYHLGEEWNGMNKWTKTQEKGILILSLSFYFIKIYRNKLQQRTTLKKTSKQAAITGVNN